jgi:hypothetical protein
MPVNRRPRRATITIGPLGCFALAVLASVLLIAAAAHR